MTPPLHIYHLPLICEHLPRWSPKALEPSKHTFLYHGAPRIFAPTSVTLARSKSANRAGCLGQPICCPGNSSTQRARNGFSYPFRSPWATSFLWVNCSNIQELKVSCMVSHLEVKDYGRVLTIFAPRSGRSFAKRRTFPNDIHRVIRDGKRGVAVTPRNGTTLG